MTTTQQKIFAERLNKTLKRRGITQTDLAQLVGVTKASISLYSTGKSIPRLNILNKIADVLQVKAEWLLGFDEKEKPQNNPNSSIYEKVNKEFAIKNFIESTTNVKVEINDYTDGAFINGTKRNSYDLDVEDENNTRFTLHINGVSLGVTDEEYKEIEEELAKLCQQIIKDIVNKKMDM